MDYALLSLQPMHNWNRSSLCAATCCIHWSSIHSGNFYTGKHFLWIVLFLIAVFLGSSMRYLQYDYGIILSQLEDFSWLRS